MNIYTDLVKKTIEDYLTKAELPKINELDKELLNKRRGCFVSIHKNDGELRGCIGTILPTHKNLAGEIISNSIEAAFKDPRFPPIAKDELDNLKFSVDVLSEPELIKSSEDLNPKKYGLIVKSLDGRTGLLLPNLEDVDTINKQLDITYQKAGISKDEEVLLYRFTTERHAERRAERRAERQGD